MSSIGLPVTRCEASAGTGRAHPRRSGRSATVQADRRDAAARHRRSRRCSPSCRPTTSRSATAGCTNRSGTGSAASCSATATRSSWPAATSARSPATSPSCSSRCRAQLPDRCVVDGEIVDRRRPTTAGSTSTRCCSGSTRPSRGCGGWPPRRRRRSSPSTCSRSATTSLLDAPFTERRARLVEVLGDAVRRRSTSPRHHRRRHRRATGSSRFEGAGLDGVVAKRLDGPYTPDKRTMVKVKHDRTAECVVAGYRIHKDGKGVGSLLLGLYDDDGRLHHVGVASGFTVKQRAELLDELAPLTRGRARRSPVARMGGGAGPRGGHGCRAHAAGGTPARTCQLGADPRRAGGRGALRSAPERPVPPRRVVPALAPRPRAGELHLRPTRRRRPRGVRRAVLAGSLRSLAAPRSAEGSLRSRSRLRRRFVTRWRRVRVMFGLWIGRREIWLRGWAHTERQLTDVESESDERRRSGGAGGCRRLGSCGGRSVVAAVWRWCHRDGRGGGRSPAPVMTRSETRAIG